MTAFSSLVNGQLFWAIIGYLKWLKTPDMVATAYPNDNLLFEGIRLCTYGHSWRLDCMDLHGKGRGMP
jgi:hypothetical protein